MLSVSYTHLDVYKRQVFNAVEILCESDEYYIIKEGNSYGLSNYDHIVQDGEDVKEDEVVF